MSLSTKVLFFRFSSLLLLLCQKTLVFWFFSISVGLEFFNITLEFIEKKSQYKSFTTRKQQQLGENKKIRLWSTGNSYFSWIFPIKMSLGALIRYWLSINSFYQNLNSKIQMFYVGITNEKYTLELVLK